MKLTSFICLLICFQTLFAQSSSSEVEAIQRLDSLYQASASVEEQLKFAKSLEKDYAEESDTNKAKLAFYTGHAYKELAQIPEACQYLEQALDFWGKSELKHLLYAKTLSNLAYIYYYNLDRFQEAETHWKQALAMREQVFGQKEFGYALELQRLAGMYLYLQRFEDAEMALLETLTLMEQQQHQGYADYAETLFRLGLLYRNTGEYTRSETFYLRALSLEEELAGEKSPKVLRNLYSLALLYDAQGELKKAETIQKKLLQLREETQGKKNSDYAENLNALAIIYSKKQAHKEALPLYQEVLALYKALGMQNSPYYYNSLNNLAITQELLGNYDEAEAFYLQAVKALEKMAGLNSSGVFEIYGNLVSLYTKQADYQRADTYVRKALERQSDIRLSLPLSASLRDSLAQRVDLAPLPLLNTLQNYFLSLLSRGGQKHKAELQEISQLAFQILERCKNELNNEQDKLFILRQTSVWIELSLKFADLQTDAALIFELIERNKSVLLLEAEASRKAYSAGLLPDSLLQIEQALEKQYSQVRAQLATTPSKLQARKTLLEELSRLDIERLKFEKTIRDSYPKYAAMRYQKANVSISVLQQSLEPQMAVLSYFIGDSASYVCHIDKQSIAVERLAVTQAELQQGIKKLHQALSDYAMIQQQPQQAYALYTKQAYWFYQMIIPQRLKQNSAITDLLIIPDGELGYLPFESFLLEAAPTESMDYNNLAYLIKKYTVSYSYSASLWKETQDAGSKTNNGLLYGLAADYKASDSLLTPLGKSRTQHIRALLAPLPAARQEVEALERYFIGSFAFAQQASEKNFKEKAPDYAILHLAMHGLLNTKNPMLSCLVFSEDGDSTENNFLYAYEIANMNLKADLVVLSACETGYGRFEKGNGIASLARSFMYASVPSLLVSLWQVNDGTTAHIMAQFYSALAEGLPKDQALREAKLVYIAKAEGQAAHPAYWSPFIQLGKPSPLSLSTKKSKLNFWFLSPIGGGLALAFFWYLRKRVV